jgi:hypothetical protein
MVSDTSYIIPRVQSQAVTSKPVNKEAFDELLANPDNRSLTHVEIKLYMALSNENPDKTWLESVVRRYEEAANAALHTVFGLDVMTYLMKLHY